MSTGLANGLTNRRPFHTQRIRRQREYDRSDRRRLLRCGHSASRRDDDVDLEPDEFSRDLGKAFAAPLRPTPLDRGRAALDPAKLPAIRAQMDTLRQKLGRARRIQRDRPGSAAVLVSEVLSALDILAAAREDVSGAN